MKENCWTKRPKEPRIRATEQPARLVPKRDNCEAKNNYLSVRQLNATGWFLIICINSLANSSSTNRDDRVNELGTVLDRWSQGAANEHGAGHPVRVRQVQNRRESRRAGGRRSPGSTARPFGGSRTFEKDLTAWLKSVPFLDWHVGCYFTGLRIGARDCVQIRGNR